MSYKLNQTKQCVTCPWRATATVKDIPNYDFAQHQGLIDTIANPDDISGINRPLRVMACHYSTKDKNLECIGWIHNQLGRGNNIPLRMQMMECSNAKHIQIDGEQKENFSETFD